MDTKKASDFISALETLCKEYEVQVCVSRYDPIILYNSNPDAPFIWCSGILWEDEGSEYAVYP